MTKRNMSIDMTKKELETEIRRLIAWLAPEGTGFEWCSTIEFGRCKMKLDPKKDEPEPMTIQINYTFASINSWEAVRYVVLHEIAHARTPGHRHDEIWQRENIRLGGDGAITLEENASGGKLHVILGRYVGICPVCGEKIYSNRKKSGDYYCCDPKRTFTYVLNPELDTPE